MTISRWSSRGNPLGFESDDLVFEKSADSHTAAILANVSGTQLCLIEVAGSFGRDLAEHGEAAMVEFRCRLAGRPLRRRSEEGDQALTAPPAGTASPWRSAPSRLRRPAGKARAASSWSRCRTRVWFAGEAVHETLWGTVGGAWESGERAADAVLHRLGPVKEPPPVAAAPTTRKSQRVRVEPHKRNNKAIENSSGAGHRARDRS